MGVLGFKENFHFWAIFENFKKHQVEQKIHIFGKKIYSQIVVKEKMYIAQKNSNPKRLKVAQNMKIFQSK